MYYEILSHDTDHEYFIDLASPARQTLQHKLVVENPMLDTTVFTASCTHPDVTVPEVIAVPGKEKVRQSHELIWSCQLANRVASNE